MENIMRNFFLFLSRSKILTRSAKKYGLRFGAARFVAGETIEQAVAVIKDLNRKGLKATVDYLGEFVDNEREADKMLDNCIKAIEVIGREKLDSQISLKLTSMGMDLSNDIVMANMKRIMEKAKENHVFVTIDMEDYDRCEKTLRIFKQFRSEYDNIGTVIQAYLFRAIQDMKDLDEYAPSLRLVKGAYKESPKVAFPDKPDVDENYKNIIRMHLLHGHYTAVATHDYAIIEFTKQFVKENEIPNDQFEFQMLYGIRTERQLELAKEGYTMRVYVPYGTDWYGYFMRRLAERPANVSFVLKGMLKK